MRWSKVPNPKIPFRRPDALSSGSSTLTTILATLHALVTTFLRSMCSEVPQPTDLQRESRKIERDKEGKREMEMIKRLVVVPASSKPPSAGFGCHSLDFSALQTSPSDRAWRTQDVEYQRSKPVGHTGPTMSVCCLGNRPRALEKLWLLLCFRSLELRAQRRRG